MRISARTWTAFGTSAFVLFVYCTACIAPAIDFGPPRGGPHGLSGESSGIATLATGWMQLIVITSPQITLEHKISAASWLANPIGLLGLILLACRLPMFAVFPSGIALNLGVWYLIYPTGKPMIGAYLWVASMALLVISCIAVSIVGWFTLQPKRHGSSVAT
jgi:hypothetical protein